jgi:hypothetical protein
MSTQTFKITPETMMGTKSMLSILRKGAPKENKNRKTGLDASKMNHMLEIPMQTDPRFTGVEITNILFPALVSEVGDEDVWSETKFYRLNNAANNSRWTLATRNSRRKISSNRGKRSPKKQSEFKPMTFRTNDGATKIAHEKYGYGDYGEQYTLRQMIEACHMEKYNAQPNLECGAKSKSIPEGLVACLKDDEVAPTSQQLEIAEVAFWEKYIHGSANNEGSSSTTTTTTTTTSVWSRFDVTDVLCDYPFNVQRMLLKLFVKHIVDMDEPTGKTLLVAYRKMILEDSKRIEEFERQACYQINKETDGIFKGQRRALDALGIESVEHPKKPKGQPYGNKQTLGYETKGGNWRPLSNHRLAWVCDPKGPKNLFMTEVTSTGAEALDIPFDSRLGSSLKTKKKKASNSHDSSEEEDSSSSSDSSSESSSSESSSSEEEEEEEEEEVKSKKKKKKKKKQVESSEEEDDDEEEVEEDDEEEEVTKQVKSKKKKKKKKKQEEDDDEEEEDEEEDNEDEEEVVDEEEDDEEQEEVVEEDDDEEEEEEVVDEEEEDEVDKERAKRTKDYEKHPVATLKKIYKTKYQSKHGQTPSEENWPTTRAALVQKIMELESLQVNEEEESTDGSSSKKRKRDDFDNMKLCDVKSLYREYCPSGRTPKKRARMIEKIIESQQ